MKMFCHAFKNTKDGTLNLAPENILNEQLVFSLHLSPANYQADQKAIEYDTEKISSDISVINLWEAAFPQFKAVWEKIEDSKGNIWHAWVIHARYEN